MEKTSTIKDKYRPTTGLVLGKFAPFHKGHQYLVEQAREQCDEVFVMIYNCPETINVPLDVRSAWVRKLYPDVRVIEAWDGPIESGHSNRIKKLQENYVKRILPKPVTHFFSSEWYGEHMSQALNAVNVVVDQDRNTVSTSGTKVRTNPHQERQFMDNQVYKEFVQRVVFLGAESTGKSTLAKALAKEFGTKWVHEYGREYWEQNKDEQGKISLEQLVEVAQVHRQREDEQLAKAHQYLFIDTNAITTCMFSQLFHDQVHPKLERYARLSHERYDYWFVCETDIPYEDDGTRHGEDHRQAFQTQIKKDLADRGIKHVVLTGNLKERVQQVKDVLNQK